MLRYSNCSTRNILRKYAHMSISAINMVNKFNVKTLKSRCHYSSIIINDPEYLATTSLKLMNKNELELYIEYITKCHEKPELTSSLVNSFEIKNSMLASNWLGSWIAKLLIASQASIDCNLFPLEIITNYEMHQVYDSKDRLIKIIFYLKLLQNPSSANTTKQQIKLLKQHLTTTRDVMDINDLEIPKDLMDHHMGVYIKAYELARSLGDEVDYNMFKQISAVLEDYLKTLQKNDTPLTTSFATTVSYSSNSNDRSSMDASDSNHVNDKSLAVLVDGLEAVSGIYLDAVYPVVEYISDLNPTVILNMLSISPSSEAKAVIPLLDINQQQQQQHVVAAIENYQQERVKLYDTLLDCFKYITKLHGGNSSSNNNISGSSNKTASGGYSGSNTYCSMSNNSYSSNNIDDYNISSNKKKIDGSQSNVVLNHLLLEQEQQTEYKILNNNYNNNEHQQLPPVRKQQLPDLLSFLQHDRQCISNNKSTTYHNNNNDSIDSSNDDPLLPTILPLSSTHGDTVPKNVKDFYSTNRVHMYLTDKGLVCKYHEKKAADICKNPKFDQVEFLFDSLLHANYNYNNNQYYTSSSSTDFFNDDDSKVVAEVDMDSDTNDTYTTNTTDTTDTTTNTTDTTDTTTNTTDTYTTNTADTYTATTDTCTTTTDTDTYNTNITDTDTDVTSNDNDRSDSEPLLIDDSMRVLIDNLPNNISQESLQHSLSSVGEIKLCLDYQL